jgi:hypothetical protein
LDISIDLREAGCEVMDWTHLAQDWDQWLAPVNLAMPSLKRQGIYWLAEWLLLSEEEFCCMKFILTPLWKFFNLFICRCA